MRKEEIKQAALTLFANNGFEGTSLADIAGVVGLKKQSIYSHFKDKDDLFLSIMKDAKSTEIDTTGQNFGIVIYPDQILFCLVYFLV